MADVHGLGGGVAGKRIVPEFDTPLVEAQTNAGTYGGEKFIWFFTQLMLCAGLVI